MEKYKVTLTLKSGIVRVHRIKSEPEQLDRILKMIDKAWQDSKIDGYVSFRDHYYRISDISHYNLKKAWFV